MASDSDSEKELVIDEQYESTNENNYIPTNEAESNHKHKKNTVQYTPAACKKQTEKRKTVSVSRLKKPKNKFDLCKNQYAQCYAQFVRPKSKHGVEDKQNDVVNNKRNSNFNANDSNVIKEKNSNIKELNPFYIRDGIVKSLKSIQSSVKLEDCEWKHIKHTILEDNYSVKQESFDDEGNSHEDEIKKEIVDDEEAFDVRGHTFKLQMAPGCKRDVQYYKQSDIIDQIINSSFNAKKSNMIDIEIGSSDKPSHEFKGYSYELKKNEDTVLDDHLSVKQEPFEDEGNFAEDITIEEHDVKEEILNRQKLTETAAFGKNCFEECADVKCEHRKFKMKANLHNHMLTQSSCKDGIKEKCTTCPVCKKTLKTQSALTHHSLVHSNARPHLCKICKTSFKEAPSLRRHMWTHLDKQHQCKICQKHFVEKNSLMRHMKTIHADEQTQTNDKHSCLTCKKEFASFGKFDRHNRRHGNPDFECSFCGKVYAGPSQLRVHMRIHTGERPFKCEVCQKSFTLKHVMQAHMKHMHKHVDNYACNLCTDVFHRKKDLTNHLTTHLTENPIVSEENLEGDNKLDKVKQLQKSILLLNSALSVVDCEREGCFS